MSTESLGPDPESGNTGPSTYEDEQHEQPQERFVRRRSLDMGITLSDGGHVRLIGRGLSPSEMREVLRIVEASLGDDE